MSLLLSLSSLALRQLVDGACTVAGVAEGGNTALGVAIFLKERFTDHSKRLTVALHTANHRAWKALELALVGDSLLERCKTATARTEDKAFARQVRAFLDATSLPEQAEMKEFRPKCLGELRAARKAGLFTMGDLPPGALAEQTGAFARFSDPQSLLDGEWRVVHGMAQTLKEAGFAHLALLLAQRPPQGPSLLVTGARYFFRRAVEDDPKLAQGLAFSQMERLSKTQEEGFASLAAAMTQQGRHLEELLGDVRTVVVETHSAVLDLQGQIEGQTGHIQQIGEAVQKLLEQHQLQRRELWPGDSMSIRNDNERQLVKQLVARYRALPEEERRQVPALLNGIGKLEVVAGDFDAARKDFAAVATLVEDTRVQAEAHFNAYQVCLEARDWPAAIQEFVKAVKLDGKRFASFPVGKYQPQRILGAGGFGVAFLCKHKYMDAQVVVKTLMLEDLGRDADKVSSEAQLLRQLDHPAIIRISDCGYVDAASKSRPFLVMDYFEGGTLEEYVKKHGPLSVDDVLALARPLAQGLQAAHGKGILHRDVKPANLLIRKDGANWQAKVIDFGLALRQKVVRTSMSASTSRRIKTLVGESMAGTLDYAAPEQMGKRNDPAGPYSDVYGWAKTCCYALFQTTQPLLKHWQSIPQSLAELLEQCLDEDPSNRQANFGEVLSGLTAVDSTGLTAAADTVSLSCPHCQKSLLFPNTFVGKTVRCLGCNEIFTAMQPAERPERYSIQDLKTCNEIFTAARPEETVQPSDEFEKVGERPSWPARPRRRAPSYPSDEEEAVDVIAVSRPHRGGMVLTLGILTLVFAFCCVLICWILGPITLTIASTDLKQMAMGKMDRSGQGQTQIGRMLSAIGLILGTVIIISSILVNALEPTKR